jgi:hypothetical protein
MLTIDDFVMLGKTVPEPSRDGGRVFVCSAGYSPTLRSLIRIYPLSRKGAPPTWSISTVNLERNPQDSRCESYRLAGDRSPGAHDRINDGFQVTGEVPKGERPNLLARCVLPSIAEANRRIAGYGKDKTSLAIIHGEAMGLEFDHNEDSPESPQLKLFDLPGATPSAGARRFPFVPKLRFHDEGGPHRLSLREWGVFELMRKHGHLTDMSEGERRSYVTGAVRLNPASALLVGNQNNVRTSWLVIAVLNGLREDQLPLGELLAEAVAR